VRSRTGEGVILEQSGFITFEGNRGYFLFRLIDVSDYAYLTGVFVQWSGLYIILFCVLIFLAVKRHEILQILTHIRKSLVDKKYFTSISLFIRSSFI
jgi:hypothetical protein